MPPNQENTPGQGPGELEVLKQEVQRQTSQEIKQQVDETKIKAGEVQQALELSLNQRRELLHSFEGRANDPDTLKGKAQDVKKAVIKILFAQEQGKIPQITGKPPEVGVLAGDLVTQISSRIKPHDVSEQTAPYLFNILSKAINGDIENVQTLAQEFKKLGYLSFYSNELYKRLYEAVTKVAENRGLGQEYIKKQFGPIEEKDEKREKEQEFEQKWNQYYSSFFRDHRDVLEAIHDPDKFVEYTEKIREQIITERRGQNIGQDHLDELVSEEIEKKFILTLSLPYNIADREKPTKTFKEILQEKSDPLYGIISTNAKIQEALTRLREHFIRNPEKNILRYVKKSSNIYKEEVEKKRSEGVATDERGMDPVFLPHRRVDPRFKNKKVTLAEFIQDLSLTLTEYLGTREYLHNTNALFHQPTQSDRGFYGGLKQYTEQMPAGNIDELMLFPDSDIFQTAHQLYIKYLEGDFAAANWIHTSEMFATTKTTRTEVQNYVLEMLEKLYPDVAKKEPWRLETALNMAIGASRGVFFEEPEIAAFADPPVDPATGKAIIRSYYLRDAAPLVPLNPMHHIWRWQFESTTNPIFFLPVEGVDFSGLWDHRTLWEKMKNYRGTYLKGRKDFGKDKNKKEEKLFMDFLMNIGGVGGPFHRKGWRYEAGFSGLYEYIKEGSERKGLDYLKTWKNLENVGYEALWHFVTSGQITGGGSEIMKDGEKKTELFSHIFKKYFNGDIAGLNTYLGELRIKAREEVLKQIRKGDLAPENLEDAIEAEVSNMFLYRGLSRVVAQRMPTKFIRLERNRETQDGVRVWEKLRKTTGLNSNIFDNAIKDIMFAETLLRKEVSLKMKESKGMLSDLVDRDTDFSLYKLTSEKLHALLSKSLASEGQGVDSLSPAERERIKKAIKVFDTLQEQYTGNEDYLNYFGQQIRDKKHPFSFASEEIDMNYISFTAMGSRMLARAVGDLSDTEMKLVNEINKFPELLKAIASNGKFDFSDIVKSLHGIRNTMESVGGADEANKIARYLADLTIAYFKKDSTSKILMGAGGIGQLNSLAAEVAGRSVAVWEWDSLVIDKFCIALETLRVLPRDPYELQTDPVYEPVWTDFFGLLKDDPVKLPWKRRKKDLKETTAQLRKEFGGSWTDIAWDMASKYLPLASVIVLFYFLSSAFKEAFDKKEK